MVAASPVPMAFLEVRFDSRGAILQLFPVIALRLAIFALAPLRFPDIRRPDKKAYYHQQNGAQEDKDFQPCNIEMACRG